MKTPVTIVVSRASDLIGQPVDLVKYSMLAMNRSNGDAKGVLPDLSPVSFSRVSSRFGARYHPVLRTVRAHNGIDLAAPAGTGSSLFRLPLLQGHWRQLRSPTPRLSRLRPTAASTTTKPSISA